MRSVSFFRRASAYAAATEHAIRRLTSIALCAFACGCAGNAASQKEVADLRAEVRSLQQTNERLEARIDRLEDQAAVAKVAQKKPQGASAEQPWDGEKVPDLTVVKLKPKHERAPPLATETAVKEPDAQDLEALLESDGAQAKDDKNALDPEAADAAFDHALTALRTGDISGAVLKLQTFAEENPRHARSDNALYYSGVGLMSLDDFDGASRAFERVLKEYPAGDARIESLLKLADCRLKQNQRADARALYAKLISTYPGTPAAQRAQERLAQLTQ